MWWRKAKAEETVPEDWKHKQQKIQDAVDAQMQQHWTSVSGTGFDSIETLKAKQARLNKIAAWAKTVEHPLQRKAYERWVSVAQYTIDHEFENQARKVEAREVNLPKLPF